MTASYFRVGGLAMDIPEGFLDRCEKFVDEMPAHIDEYERLLTKNPIWLARTQGRGAALGDATRSALGATGPTLRGSGVNWDLRKAEPYSRLRDATTSTCRWAAAATPTTATRCASREMRQSTRIAKQAIQRVRELGETGEYRLRDFKYVLPPKEEVKTSMEALIHHFKIVAHGFFPPVGEAYQAVEAPKGELGFYFVTDGIAAALAHEGALAVVREPAGAARDGGGPAGRRRDHRDRQHRHRARGDRPMSPTAPSPSNPRPNGSSGRRRRAEVAEAVARYPVKRSAVLPVLWIAQREWGWLPPAALRLVARTLELPEPEVFGIATFYTMFNLKPVGRHHLQVCMTLSCSLMGADRLFTHLERKLGVGHGETTPDGRFTLRRVECLAACGTGRACRSTSTTTRTSTKRRSTRCWRS